MKVTLGSLKCSEYTVMVSFFFLPGKPTAPHFLDGLRKAWGKILDDTENWRNRKVNKNKQLTQNDRVSRRNDSGKHLT